MDLPSSFPLFPTLPSELRIKVWEHTFPESRVVPVRYSRTVNQYIANSLPPAIAQACSESRSLFLSLYTKLILSPRYDSAVFVDFTRDTIFFDTFECSPEGDLSLDLAMSPHASRILYCAIDAQLWEILRVFKYDSLSEVKLMPNLRTVALVLQKDKEGRGFRHNLVEDGHAGAGVAVGEDSNTVAGEIRHVHWYVESLKWELKHGIYSHGEENRPNVQLWLW